MGTLNVSEVNDLCPVCAFLSPIGEKALGGYGQGYLTQGCLSPKAQSGLAYSTCAVSFPQMKKRLSQNKVSVIRYQDRGRLSAVLKSDFSEYPHKAMSRLPPS